MHVVLCDFGSNMCDSTALSTDGPKVMAKLEQALLTQHAYIKEFIASGKTSGNVREQVSDFY